MAGIGAVNQIDSQKNEQNCPYKHQIIKGQELEEAFGLGKFTGCTQFYIQAPRLSEYSGDFLNPPQSFLSDWKYGPS